jgi:hypothetical protein
MPYQSDRRLYLTADKAAVVEHGDTRAAFLLVGKNGLVSDADAERYGLTHLPYVEPEIRRVAPANLGNVDMTTTGKLGRYGIDWS